MKPLGMALLLGGLVIFGGLIYYNVSTSESRSKECPGHWHATFGVFTPDANGAPQRLDFGIPRGPGGQRYYQLNVANIQSVAAHMHQSGAEQGSDALGIAQMHYEGGKCVGIRNSLKATDVLLDDGSLQITGQHAQANRTGVFEDNGDMKVRFYLQSWNDDARAWVWAEANVADHLSKQAKDGESFLVAYGDYTDEQVRFMQGQIVPPISRTNPAAPAATTEAPHEPAPTSTSTSVAPQ